MSASDGVVRDGKMLKMLDPSMLHADEEMYTTKDPGYLPPLSPVNTESTIREESGSRVPFKRERSWDVLDFDSPAFSGVSYSDGEDEPPRKRGRAEYSGDSDDPEGSATFVIYSDDDCPQSTSSLSHDDMSKLKAKFEDGGSVGSIDNPAAAVAWIENNWEDPLLLSIQKKGYDGPFAQMLFLGKPALALFGPRTDKFLRDSAGSLTKLSGFPVVIRPSSDAPRSVLALTEIGHERPVGGSSHDDQLDSEATDLDGTWEHRTRLTLRMKAKNNHTHAVTIRHNFKFHVDGDRDLVTGRASVDPISSESEVIALVDLRVETPAREAQIDRSYASIGFLAHREESIKTHDLARKSDLSDKIIPEEWPGDKWDEDSKSYWSYNIAYEPQLNPRRSEAHSLEVKVGMGINLKPPGSEKPLPQISFIHRTQILVWVSDPGSKARLRGIVVSMSNYVDDIQKPGLVKEEFSELNLVDTGTPYPRQGISPVFLELEITDRRSSDERA
ncbi:hypothetical protein K438DRAFT_1771058 [Mycena galopus ATCC 62051]|nr:hypothetical protein K438DRAFT_1771058 [Mycena galopus ATCC 62051]